MPGLDNFFHVAVAFGAATVAGVANAIAGGGTVVAFPALVWLGLPAVAASATNSVALWPGSISAAWSYRTRLAAMSRTWLWMVPVVLAGGALGAWLLIRLPPAWFRSVAPFLVVGASIAVAVEPIVRRRLRAKSAGNAGEASERSDRFIAPASRTQPATMHYEPDAAGAAQPRDASDAAPSQHPEPGAQFPNPAAAAPSQTPAAAAQFPNPAAAAPSQNPAAAAPSQNPAAAAPSQNPAGATRPQHTGARTQSHNAGGVAQPRHAGTATVGLFAVALYGGYFGAGIGILMLLLFSSVGVDSLHNANALKNVFAAVMKVSAIVYFVAVGAVVWPAALAMAAGAALGGYAGGRLIQRVDDRIMRAVVVAIGVAMGVGLLLRS